MVSTLMKNTYTFGHKLSHPSECYTVQSVLKNLTAAKVFKVQNMQN